MGMAAMEEKGTVPSLMEIASPLPLPEWDGHGREANPPAPLLSSSPAQALRLHIEHLTSQTATSHEGMNLPFAVVSPPPLLIVRTKRRYLGTSEVGRGCIGALVKCCSCSLVLVMVLDDSVRTREDQSGNSFCTRCEICDGKICTRLGKCKHQSSQCRRVLAPEGFQTGTNAGESVNYQLLQVTLPPSFTFVRSK